jgi:hypothetical protein
MGKPTADAKARTGSITDRGFLGVDHGQRAAGSVARGDRGAVDDRETEVVRGRPGRIEQLPAARADDHAAGKGARGVLDALDLGTGAFPAESVHRMGDAGFAEMCAPHVGEQADGAAAGDDQRGIAETDALHFPSQGRRRCLPWT